MEKHECINYDIVVSSPNPVTTPRCDQCGRFTTNPEVFIYRPGVTIEYQLCKRCEESE